MFDLIIQQEIFCWDFWLPLSRFKKKIEKKKASYCIDSECLLFNYGLLFLFHLDSTFQSSKQVPNLKMFKNEPSQPNKGCIQQKSSPNRTPAWDLDPPPPGVFAAGHLPGSRLTLEGQTWWSRNRARKWWFRRCLEMSSRSKGLFNQHMSCIVIPKSLKKGSKG